MISWSYYGGTGVFEYLLGTPGDLALSVYVLYLCAPVGTSRMELIWRIADKSQRTDGCAHLVALLGLGGMVAHESRDYLRRMKESGDL
jgi:Na+/alanine symporter